MRQSLFDTKMTRRMMIGTALMAAVSSAGLLVPSTAQAESRVPNDMVGEWKWGTISSLSYEDTQTGKNLGPGRGMMIYFTFDKGGKYKMFFYVQTRSYDWTTQTWTEEEGTVTFSESGFIVQPSTGKYRVRDNRVQKNNYNRPMTKAELKKGCIFR